MGHHARGRVVFPLGTAGPPALKGRLVRVTVRGIGGVETRVFEWGPPKDRAMSCSRSRRDR
jgi:hypothetical protein